MNTLEENVQYLADRGRQKEAKKKAKRQAAEKQFYRNRELQRQVQETCLHPYGFDRALNKCPRCLKEKN